jgi:AcrR family transcriptional regulator
MAEGTRGKGAYEDRERKSDRTRRRILDAAAAELSVRGFDGVRVADVAKRAELRVPTLYYYFETREELLAEVLTIGGEMAYRNVVRTLDELPPDTSALDRVCAAFAAHLETVLRESTYVSVAVRTMTQLPPHIRQRQLRIQQRSGDLWRQLIMNAVEAGEIDPDLDPHAARMFLMGAVNWASEWWDPGRGSIEKTMETLRRFVRNALTTSASPAESEPGSRPVPAGFPLFLAPGMS